MPCIFRPTALTETSKKRCEYLFGLVQRGGNNYPVDKGEKADCISFLSFCLLPPAFCLLALAVENPDHFILAV
jgi:hypothetical protein